MPCELFSVRTISHDGHVIPGMAARGPAGVSPAAYNVRGGISCGVGVGLFHFEGTQQGNAFVKGKVINADVLREDVFVILRGQFSFTGCLLTSTLMAALYVFTPVAMAVAAAAESVTHFSTGSLG